MKHPYRLILINKLIRADPSHPSDPRSHQHRFCAYPSHPSDPRSIKIVSVFIHPIRLICVPINIASAPIHPICLIRVPEGLVEASRVAVLYSPE